MSTNGKQVPSHIYSFLVLLSLCSLFGLYAILCKDFVLCNVISFSFFSFSFGRRRVAVARYRMICLVLLIYSTATGYNTQLTLLHFYEYVSCENKIYGCVNPGHLRRINISDTTKCLQVITKLREISCIIFTRWAHA